jgi:hypothetical protein
MVKIFNMCTPTYPIDVLKICPREAVNDIKSLTFKEPLDIGSKAQVFKRTIKGNGWYGMHHETRKIPRTMNSMGKQMNLMPLTHKM